MLNNCRKLYGILCIDSSALSACAEQMPIFPAAPLIMAGIIVIELLSQSFACAELRSLTGACFCQGALGNRLTLDRTDRSAAAAHQRAPITLLWNIHDPYCFLRRTKNSITALHFILSVVFFLFFYFQEFNLAAASRRDLDTDVIHYIYATSLSCPSNRCLWMSHPSCVLEQILRGK